MIKTIKPIVKDISSIIQFTISKFYVLLIYILINMLFVLLKYAQYEKIFSPLVYISVNILLFNLAIIISSVAYYFLSKSFLHNSLDSKDFK